MIEWSWGSVNEDIGSSCLEKVEVEVGDEERHNGCIVLACGICRIKLDNSQEETMTLVKS